MPHHTHRRTPRRAPVRLLVACATLLTTLPAEGGPFPTPAAAQETFGDYPAARAGGMYMRNYYLPPAPSSTPWAPAWHPDRRHVLVSMQGSIWSVEVATGVATELVRGPMYYSSPHVSPDGRWVIYTADDHGRSVGLEVLDTHTGERRVLSSGPHVFAEPRFSPDGGRVAYVSTEPSGTFNVYIRAFRDGAWDGPPRPVTRDHSFGRDRLYFGPRDIHISPAWLPSGEELLLVSNRDVPLGSGNVFRVPARADGFQARTTVLKEQTLYRTRPDVSPDGKRFVFSSTRGAADQYNNLYLQPTAGGEPYKLTLYSHDAFHPRWSPDGEWIAYIDNRDGLPALKLLETYGGKVVDVEIRERKWLRPMGRLRVRTVDAHGRPTATRIHLTAADGRFHAPPDQYARIAPRAGRWAFHQPGDFEVELPEGEVRLTAVKGFEHWPVDTTAQVRAGATTELRIRMVPFADLSAQGWWGASTHVHMNYGGNLHNTLENLMFMSDAEDQDLVLEQIANKDNRILDHQFFVPGGREHPLSTADRILVVGQEYRPPFYGHVFMFGMREHLLSPYTTGYEGTAIESLYPSNTDMLAKAKAQGAWTGYVHSFYSGDPLEGNLGGAKGFIVDAALGTTDAVEWSRAQDGFPPLYAVWSNGLRVSVVGGEDSISDLHLTPMVGSVRTYVRTGDGRLSMRGWFEGMRAGRAFVTSGPLLRVDVGGAGPGEELRLAAGEDVPVRLEVRSIVPLEVAEVVMSGEVVARVPFEGDRRSLVWEGTLRPQRSEWVHLRVRGRPEDRFPLDINYPQAITNPVWLIVDDAPVRSVAAADYALRWIDRLQAMAEAWPHWRSDAERAHVFGQFDEARAIYTRRRAEAEAGLRPGAELEPEEEAHHEVHHREGHRRHQR